MAAVAVSLAAIFTVPLAVSDGQPFPGRDLLLFCTFLVVVVTLVGQGLTFGLVTRLLDQLAASGEVGGPVLAEQVRREVIDAQREELLRWRDAGHLPDTSLRVLQRELDHEEQGYRERTRR